MKTSNDRVYVWGFYELCCKLLDPNIFPHGTPLRSLGYELLRPSVGQRLSWLFGRARRMGSLRV